MKVKVKVGPQPPTDHTETTCIFKYKSEFQYIGLGQSIDDNEVFVGDIQRELLEFFF